MATEVWGQDSVTVGYCAFCPEWRIEGTAREVAELSRQHRASVHSDLSLPVRRRRANLGKWRNPLNTEESALVEQERSLRLRLLGIDVEE